MLYAGLYAKWRCELKCKKCTVSAYWTAGQLEVTVTDSIHNGQNNSDFTHWFLQSHFEALKLSENCHVPPPNATNLTTQKRVRKRGWGESKDWNTPMNHIPLCDMAVRPRRIASCPPWLPLINSQDPVPHHKYHPPPALNTLFSLTVHIKHCSQETVHSRDQQLWVQSFHLVSQANPLLD